MAVDVLIGWLAGSVAAPDTFTRTVNAIRGTGAEYRRLTKNVRETTGKLPRHAYRRWFYRDSTWGGLATRCPCDTGWDPAAAEAELSATAKLAQLYSALSNEVPESFATALRHAHNYLEQQGMELDEAL